MTNENDVRYAEKLKKEYSSNPKEQSKLDELKALDKKVKQPVILFAYIFGIIGSLILGLGMCLAMNIIGGTTALMIVGVIIGIIGIAMISATYPIYNITIANRKKKYSKEILALSDELLKNND